MRGGCGYLVGAGICLSLVAILGPNMRNSALRGPAMACRSNLKNIALATEFYRGEHKGEYPSNLEQLVPKYLNKIPQCPRSKTPSYSYRASARAPGFQVRCEAEHTRWYFWSDTRNNSPGAFRFDSNKGILLSDDPEPPWPPTASPTPNP